MRGLTNITIGGAFADVLKGKSKEELKKIFGGEVPPNIQELLASTDKKEEPPVEEGAEEKEPKGKKSVVIGSQKPGDGQR